jgi:hypothetical protein
MLIVESYRRTCFIPPEFTLLSTWNEGNPCGSYSDSRGLRRGSRSLVTAQKESRRLLEIEEVAAIRAYKPISPLRRTHFLILDFLLQIGVSEIVGANSPF